MFKKYLAANEKQEKRLKRSKIRNQHLQVAHPVCRTSSTKSTIEIQSGHNFRFFMPSFLGLVRLVDVCNQQVWC